MRPGRAALVVLHCWLGLFTVTFLIVAGISGAIISWDHELDAWPNPDLFHARSAGTAGDIFLHAQFPLHSGRIIGLPGRILVSYLELVVAILAITGIEIWTRKRTAARARTPIALECAATARATASP